MVAQARKPNGQPGSCMPNTTYSALRPGQKLVTSSSDFTPASIVASPLPPPQPPPDSPLFHPTVCFHPTMETETGFRFQPSTNAIPPSCLRAAVPDTSIDNVIISTVNELPPPDPPPCAAPSPLPVTHIIPRADDMPDASSPVPDTSHNQDSPRRFSLPAEDNVLGLEEDVLGLPFTEFPSGSFSSGCAGATSPCTVADLDLYEGVWTDEIRAQLPVPASLQDSLVHIVRRPRVCGIFIDTTRVYAFTLTDTMTPTRGLFDRSTNLCMPS